MTRKQRANTEWPSLLQRYVDETKPRPENLPRRVRRRFHNMDVTLWQGFVHIDNVIGYAENMRLKFYLNRWRSRMRDPGRIPTPDEIADIMLEADDDESQESRKPFHVRRMAANIARNGIQEPIVVYFDGDGAGELWDGNRRFFSARFIMKDPQFGASQDQATWIPALVVTPSGSTADDLRMKHAIITQLNFVEKDHIPWPAYVKAAEIHAKFRKLTQGDPTDSTLARDAKQSLAEEYGLKGWRVADRWIKMYDLALQFKDYHEAEHAREEVEVDLKIQEKFEYFDEMSKPGVYGAMEEDIEAREAVFNWLWDGKFKAFADVRMVPRILADPVARRHANAGDDDSVKRAIRTVLVNDPVQVKDKEAANE